MIFIDQTVELPTELLCTTFVHHRVYSLLEGLGTVIVTGALLQPRTLFRRGIGGSSDDTESHSTLRASYRRTVPTTSWSFRLP